VGGGGARLGGREGRGRGAGGGGGGGWWGGGGECGMGVGGVGDSFRFSTPPPQKKQQRKFYPLSADTLFAPHSLLPLHSTPPSCILGPFLFVLLVFFMFP